MSRIGKAPITIPSGVEVTFKDSVMTVKGKKGELAQHIDASVSVSIEDNVITFSRATEAPDHRSKHGLYRALVYNMIQGVSEGFKKNLDIQGVGFKAQKQGNTVIFNLGYSHTIELVEPTGITIDVPAPNKVVVSGADKQLVGEIAAKIRSYRVPDAYKGKGVKYDFEVLKLKEGKTGAKAK